VTALTWSSRTTVGADPEHVLDTLTDTEACARWSPIPFSLETRGDPRLRPGTTAQVSGRVLGAPVRFHLQTLSADADGLRLRAQGPVDIAVHYVLRPVTRGCDVDARISIHPNGSPLSRLVARATRALLAAGTLERSLQRIAREAERAARDAGMRRADDAR
jgi:Polyketide cyclase / dehydrase and lipid transport